MIGMKTTTLFTLFFLLIHSLYSQSLLSGYVNTTEDDLSGTVVINLNKNCYGAVTDIEGYYEIEGEVGDCLTFSRLGYEPLKIMVKRPEDIAEVFMKGTTFNLPEVVVLDIQPMMTSCIWSCGKILISEKEEVVQKKKRDNSIFTPLIKTYPNPTLGRLTIDLPEMPILVEIFDMNGAQIRRCQLNGEKNLNLSAYPAGTYILRCSDQDGHLIGSTPVVKMD